MEAHGSHWGCFGDTDEFISKYLPKAIQEGSLTSVAPFYPSDNEPAETCFALCTGPNDIEIMAIVITDPDRDGKLLATAYPFILDGTLLAVSITDIEKWIGGLEARVNGMVFDEISIGFFDTFYHLTQARYENAGNIVFRIGAIAYKAEVIEPEIINVSNPEIVGPLTASDPESPTTVDIETKGMVALFPITKWDSSDFEFCGPVKSVSRIEKFGTTIYRAETTLFRSEKGDVEIPVYIPAHALKGNPPKPGDDIAGALWLQGYMDGALEQAAKSVADGMSENV